MKKLNVNFYQKTRSGKLEFVDSKMLRKLPKNGKKIKMKHHNITVKERLDNTDEDINFLCKVILYKNIFK